MYCFSRDLFDHPYQCSHCNGPLGGVDVTIDSHLNFRLHEDEIHRAFVNYEKWIAEFDLEIFSRAWVKYENSEWWNWCRTTDIRLHIAHCLNPMPKECSPQPYRDLCILRWSVQMQRTWTSREPYRSWYENEDELRYVFTNVRRNLAKWIFGEDDNQASRSEEVRNRLQRWPVNPQEWDSRELAYSIFHDAYFSPYSPRSGDFSGIPSWENRIPRLALRVFLLALYAGMYHTVATARRKGVTSWRKLERVRVGDYIIMRAEVSPTGYHRGFVMFPKIDGMPIKGRSKSLVV
jgi:hypothetical protein